MKSIFDFTVQYYFPARPIWAIVSAFFFIGAIVTQHFILATIALVLEALIFTTKYGVELNFSTKQYNEYIWVLGYKSGEPIPYEQIEYLFIKKINMTQKINSMITSTTVDNEEYRGYIRFNEQEKIHFITKQNHEALVSILKAKAKEMNVGLFDYSFGDREPFV